MTVMLAQTYTSDIDPTGFWISEKLDGLHCVWTGKNLVSRNNNVFDAPKWFTEKLPALLPMDGELFINRGCFERTSSIVSSGSKDPRWSEIKYVCFDIPEPRAGFVEERWTALQKLVEHISEPHIKFLSQTLCTGREQLEKLLDAVVAIGGEGLMLRRPKSKYERKRSDSMLKYKRYIDSEAVVVGYQESEITTPGKAHLIGSMGALLCKWNDKDIKIGTGFDDAARLNPPKVGDTITFKYLKITESGVPYSPVYGRVREEE
jgi:DNA ligase-1